MIALSDKREECFCQNSECKRKKYREEDVQEFVREVLKEMDHLNEPFEAIAMRANIESMAGDALCTKGEQDG